MKKGQKVIIFFDPITKTKKEGGAKLMHKLLDNPRGIDCKDFKLETWRVKFTTNNELAVRTIREDINPEPHIKREQLWLKEVV